VTDFATLDVVVNTLAGRINTQLVAAARLAGVRAVGLTAADANVASVQRAKPYTTTKGEIVDLGLVGQPTETTKPELLHRLCNDGFVPVITSIGCDDSGQLLNVNADTLAGHLAVQLGATQLLIAGGTAGVLDQEGQTIPTLDSTLLQQLLADGRANAGMVAKLMACSKAARSGVVRVEIIDGTETDDLSRSMGTRVDLRKPKS
jgi:acetylglutamate kinase